MYLLSSRVELNAADYASKLRHTYNAKCGDYLFPVCDLDAREPSTPERRPRVERRKQLHSRQVARVTSTGEYKRQLRRAVALYCSDSLRKNRSASSTTKPTIDHDRGQNRVLVVVSAVRIPLKIPHVVQFTRATLNSIP